MSSVREAGQIRLLGPLDRPALERYLAIAPDETMFLRSNLSKAGIVYTGATFSAEHVGLVSGANVRAVAAHCWNGILLLQWDLELEDGAQLAAHAVAISKRPVAGLIGPRHAVHAARAQLQLQHAETAMDSRDILFALDLTDLQMPDGLLGDSAAMRCRAATDQDVPILVNYRVAYHKETLGTEDSDTLPARCRDEVVRHMDGDAFVLESAIDGQRRVVACSFFNARVPDTVQIGGVFTPPAWRGRGFGRAVVAGSLLTAQAQGVERSILFTALDNLAAQRAYRSIGYRSVGEYALVLFSTL